MTALQEVLLFLIKNGPGRTEAELAVAIYGLNGYQQQVNQDCRLLVARGEVERRGIGVSGDPYRYYASEHVIPRPSVVLVVDDTLPAA
jgi:hypothetical protein